MRVIPNKFGKKCTTCGVYVKPNAGKAALEDGKWNTYCIKHGPELVQQQIKRELTADGKVITPYEPHNLDLIRAMPGARFPREEFQDGETPYWRVSLNMGDRMRLLELADRLELEVADELRVIESNPQVDKAREEGLYPFQVDGVHWMSLGSERLLADEMGLGKTVQTLASLPKNGATLCIVPASLKYNWEAECKKWRPDLKPVVLNGKKSFRWPKEGEVVIINYSILPKFLEPIERDPEAKPRRKWDVFVRVPVPVYEQAKKITLVVDEAQRVKNSNTNQAKRVRGLSMLCGRVWALTGTPLENRPMDLWGILYNLSMARTVFGTFPKFIERMNGQKGFYGGYKFDVEPQPIVPELLRRVMLRRKRQEVLPDLPMKVKNMVKVDLPQNLRGYMDTLWDEWGELIDEEHELPPFEEFSGLRAKLAESRIPALMEMVEDHEDQNVPLLVFSAHKAPVEACAAREGWDMITGSTPSAKRQEIVKAFQRGELKGLALTIKAGGVGLTLTKAWKAIFVDQDWVPSWNEQAEDRMCRIGQNSKKVEIINMVSDHVLDIHLLKLMNWKINMIEASVDRMLLPEKPEIETPVETQEIPF